MSKLWRPRSHALWIDGSARRAFAPEVELNDEAAMQQRLAVWGLAAAAAASFYASISLGAFWPAAFAGLFAIALLAFWKGPAHGFALGFGAYAIGATNILPAYGSILPPPALAIAIIAPALLFGLALAGGGLVARRLGGLAGAFGFASLWTGLHQIAALGPDGSAPWPAYALVGAPILVQTAALFGGASVTFLLGFAPAGLAASVAYRTIIPGLASLAALAGALGYGAWRIGEAAAGGNLRVALVVDDRLGNASFDADPRVALAAVDAYIAQSRSAAQDADLVIWPEKLAVLTQESRTAALESMARFAGETGATLIAGVDDREEERRNRLFVLRPGEAAPAVYDKRHLVVGLERAFAPGSRALEFAPALGAAICKDMDFPQTIRRDAAAGQLRLMAVPAWDFGADGWIHARMAILRGVENGFSVARAAKQGLLTVSDAYGRVHARADSRPDRAVVVVASAPLGPGPTLYTRLGDVFGWGCALLGAAIVALAAFWSALQFPSRART